jgi:hypothetical protein
LFCLPFCILRLLFGFETVKKLMPAPFNELIMVGEIVVVPKKMENFGF